MRNPFLFTRWVLGVGMATFVAGTACDRAPGASATTAPTTRSARDVNTLRSVPYAGFSEDEDQAGDGVVFSDRARVSPGLTLLSIHTKCRAELIDESGTVIRSWQYEGSRNWDNVELLDNGDVVVVGADPSPPGVSGIGDEKRYVLRFDWDGKLLWRKMLPAHHDIERVGRDRFRTLTFARRTIPEIDAQVETRDDQLTLLNESGESVENVGLFDILSRKPALFPLQKNEPMTQGGRSWIDIFHCNAIEGMTRADLAAKNPLYALDNILVTFRHQDRIAIFNWGSRDLVWAWGQGELDGPHDAQLLDNGNILIFDNGLVRGWSRVIEIDPIQTAIVWEFKSDRPADFYSKSKGSSQRLSNGNTLICCSDTGRVFEVTPAGECVWDYRTPHKNTAGQRATIFRAKRFTRETIDGIAARRP